MQIRNRNGKLQLIRTVYDPLIKRGKSTLIGVLASYASSIPNELNEKLTNQEREQLQFILDQNVVTMDSYRQINAARELPSTLRLATKWYLEANKPAIDLAKLAGESRSEFTALLAAMVKLGVGRTRKRKSR